MRYFYATYPTREKAEDALEDCYGNGEVSQAERPRIEPYSSTRTVEGGAIFQTTRYAITLEG
jgi:hypothetical protein